LIIDIDLYDKVHDPYSSEQFAIKKILCQTEETLQSAKREEEILTNFDHLNLLKSYDHERRCSSKVSTAEEVYLLMPFYKRGTLQTVIDRERQRKLRSMRSLHQHRYPNEIFIGDNTFDDRIILSSEIHIVQSFLTLCNGVQALHSYSPPLAHNDIKPGNVLLPDDGVNLILFDFGSVCPSRRQIFSRKDALSLQEWADANCTPLFRAPELFDVKNEALIDERTDIWSLGCTLFAMSFLESPFEEDASGGSVLLTVQSGNIHFPKDASQRFSQAFLDCILWMLTVDIQQRPFIGDVIMRLTNLLAQQQDHHSNPNPTSTRVQIDIIGSQSSETT